MNRVRWLIIVLALAVPAAFAPVGAAHAATYRSGSAAVAAVPSAAPQPPPGGKIYGPFKNKNQDPNGNYCNSILRNFYKQGAVPAGWQAQCYVADDGNWYIALWPPAEQQPASQQLNAGQFMISASVNLAMQADGNLVLYRNSDRVALWASHTNGKGGTYARFQTDGNLVVYTPSHGAVWASDTCCHGNSWLAIQDDGNLVIYIPPGSASMNHPELPTRSGGVLWASKTSA